MKEEFDIDAEMRGFGRAVRLGAQKLYPPTEAELRAIKEFARDLRIKKNQLMSEARIKKLAHRIAEESQKKQPQEGQELGAVVKVRKTPLIAEKAPPTKNPVTISLLPQGKPRPPVGKRSAETRASLRSKKEVIQFGHAAKRRPTDKPKKQKAT